MNQDHYPGIRLKQLLADAGLLDQFDGAVRSRGYARMKELIQQVASSQEEAQQFTGVVFANPEHYDKVISDLHYNGKTVNDRLAAEGLLDQFTAAIQARESARMIELLQEAAITKTWATRLTAMILDGPAQPPIHLRMEDGRNAGLRHTPNSHKFPPCIRPVESPRDPYWNLGSHPEAVERVWDQLGSTLPEDCRCIVYGTPGLVAPRSGILIAKAFGTAYVLRVPRGIVAEATQAGCETKKTWGQNRMALRLDLIGLTTTKFSRQVSAAAQTLSGEGSAESCAAAP
ncbi:MAG: hypothetical protein ABSG68_13490, partial [Thermoguttaceae bacterium]